MMRQPAQSAPPATAEDVEQITAQLGRPVRGVISVVYRCGCGHPAVISTRPRLADGTPFPTFYYLTCPQLAAQCSTLESEGLMDTYAQLLADDPIVAEAYQTAHDAYLAARREYGDPVEIQGVSAGGMPTRVKCLHALLAHALAEGPGVNPIGDLVINELQQRWPEGRTCVTRRD